MDNPICDSQASSYSLTASLVLTSDYTLTQTSTQYGHTWVSSATDSKTIQAFRGPVELSSTLTYIEVSALKIDSFSTLENI